MSDLRRIAGAALALALALAPGAPPARAEVGASPGGGGKPWVVILKSLVDDPEPIGIVWSRYRLSTPEWQVLNDGGYANADGDPSVVMTADGTALVVWSRNSAQGYDVVYSRFDGGAWSEPELLAGTAPDELDPQAFLDPADGSVHVVYWVDDAVPRVMHVQAPADLSSWTAAEQVSEPSIPAFRPSGVFHDGALRVVYELHDFGIGTTPRQIMFATKSGGSFEREMLSITLHDAPNRPQVHSANGYLWVDWIDAVDHMAWMRMTPAGGWGPVETVSFATPAERDFHTRMTIRTLAAH